MQPSGRSAAGGVRRRRAAWSCALCRACSRVVTWSGSSRPGRPRKSASSSEPTAACGAELAAVEEHPVEGRLGGQRLEARARPRRRSVCGPVRLRQQRVLRRERGRPRRRSDGGRGRGRARAPSRPRAAAAGAPTAGRPTRSRPDAGPARTAPPPGRRTAVSRSRWRRRRRTSRGTSTPSETIRTATIQRSSPAAKASIRALAPGLVGQHQRRRLTGDPPQLRGVRPGREVVGGDDQAAGVGHAHGVPRSAGGRRRRAPAGSSCPAGPARSARLRP